MKKIFTVEYIQIRSEKQYHNSSKFTIVLNGISRV